MRLFLKNVLSVTSAKELSKPLGIAINIFLIHCNLLAPVVPDLTQNSKMQTVLFLFCFFIFA